MSQSPQLTDQNDIMSQSPQLTDQNDIMSQSSQTLQNIDHSERNRQPKLIQLPQETNQDDIDIHAQLSTNVNQNDIKIKPLPSAHTCLQDVDSYLKPSKNIDLCKIGGDLNLSQNGVQHEMEDQNQTKKEKYLQSSDKTVQTYRCLVEDVNEEGSFIPSKRQEVQNYSDNDSDTDDNEDDMIMIDFNHDSDYEENAEDIELNKNIMDFGNVKSADSSLVSIKRNDEACDEQKMDNETISNGPGFQNIQELTISNEPQFQQSDAASILPDICSAKNESDEKHKVIIKILQEKVTAETEEKWFEGITNTNKTAIDISYDETVDKKIIFDTSENSCSLGKGTQEKIDSVNKQTTYLSNPMSQQNSTDFHGSFKEYVSKPLYVYNYESVCKEDMDGNLQEVTRRQDGEKNVEEVLGDFSGDDRIDVSDNRNGSCHNQEMSDTTCDNIIYLSSDDEEITEKDCAETESIKGQNSSVSMKSGVEKRENTYGSQFPSFQNICNTYCTINGENGSNQNDIKVKVTADSPTCASKCALEKTINSQQHISSSFSELALCSDPEAKHYVAVSTTCTNEINDLLPVYSSSERSQYKDIKQALIKEANESEKTILPLDGTIILLSDDEQDNDEMQQKSHQRKKTNKTVVSWVKRAGEKRSHEPDVKIQLGNKERRVEKTSAESFSNERQFSLGSGSTQTPKLEQLITCDSDIKIVLNTSKPSKCVEKSKKRTNIDTGCKSVCYLCFADFLVKDELFNHIREVHSYYQNAPTFCCTHCGSSFQSLPEVSAHEYMVHGFTNSCQLCGKLQQSEESLRQHVINHLCPVVYVCHNCKWDFQTALNVKKHIEENHNEDTIWSLYLKCHLCKCLFSSEDKLYSHFINLHSQVLKHHCRACSQNFFTADALHVHRSNSQFILNGQMVKEYTNFETDFKMLIKSMNMPSCGMSINTKNIESLHEPKKNRKDKELKKSGNDDSSDKDPDICIIDLTETFDKTKNISTFESSSQALDLCRNLKAADERCTSLSKPEETPQMGNDITPALKYLGKGKDVIQQTPCIPYKRQTTTKDNIISKPVKYTEVSSDICKKSPPENIRYNHSDRIFQDPDIYVHQNNDSQSEILTLSNKIVNNETETVKSPGVMSVCANKVFISKETNSLRDLSQNEHDFHTEPRFKLATGCNEKITNDLSESNVESHTCHINEELFRYFAEQMKGNENESDVKKSKYDDKILDELVDIQKRSQKTVELVSECLKSGKIKVEKPQKMTSDESPDDRIVKVNEQSSGHLSSSDSLAVESEIYSKTKHQILTLITNHFSNVASKSVINDKLSKELMSNSSFVLALYNSLKKSQNKKAK